MTVYNIASPTPRQPKVRCASRFALYGVSCPICPRCGRPPEPLTARDLQAGTFTGYITKASLPNIRQQRLGTALISVGRAVRRGCSTQLEQREPKKLEL